MESDGWGMCTGPVDVQGWVVDEDGDTQARSLSLSISLSHTHTLTRKQCKLPTKQDRMLDQTLCPGC
jgi:hypothetical protein